MNEQAGIMYVFEDGTTTTTSAVIAVNFELTLGDIVMIMLLAMILMLLLVQAVLKALWKE